MQTIQESNEQNVQSEISPWFSIEEHKSLVITKKISHVSDNPVASQNIQIPRVYKLFQAKNQSQRQSPTSSNHRRSLPSLFIKQINLQSNNQSNNQKNKQRSTIPLKYFKKQTEKQQVNYFMRKTLQTPAVCLRIRQIVRSNLQSSLKKTNIHPNLSRYSNKFGQITFQPSMTTKSIDFQYDQNHSQKSIKKQIVFRQPKKHVLDQILQKWT